MMILQTECFHGPCENPGIFKQGNWIRRFREGLGSPDEVSGRPSDESEQVVPIHRKAIRPI